MKNIVRILLAVALLIAVPTTMNAQSPKGKTTKGKVTTKAKTTTTNNHIDIVKKDAQKGDASAQCLLGYYYYYGKEVTQDYKQAVFWLKKAAEQGDAEAQHNLGECYHKGEGVDKDLKQAGYWFKKAAEQGIEDSKELLEEVEEEIQSLSASSSGQVYDIAEQMPSFPGGQSALFQYLSKNIQYPKLCEEHGIQGRVICSYIVEEDGSITDVQVRKSVHPSLDKEAVRVIQSMPKWNPGKENGLPVRVRYNLPITFSLK